MLERNFNLNEGEYSKSMIAMRGLRDKIETMAFLSPENPCGEPLSAEENAKRYRRLIRLLKDGFYGYRKIKGKYGVEENSFMIYNISKKDAIELGEKFEQESILFGQKMGNQMLFQVIKSFNCSGNDVVGDVVGERKVFLTLDKDSDDFFSEVGGRKFRIPFYDAEYEDAEWDGGAIVKKLSEEVDSRLSQLIKESLDTSKTGKYRWTRRGWINVILTEML